MISKKLNQSIYLLPYSLFNFSISFIILISAFIQPSEAEKAAVWGFTWARLGMGAILVFCSLFFAYLIYLSF